MLAIKRGTAPTEEEATAFIAALDDAQAAADRALSQAKRNLFHLRDARLEVETARDIANASNNNQWQVWQSVWHDWKKHETQPPPKSNPR